jgi:hypothetical protein
MSTLKAQLFRYWLAMNASATQAGAQAAKSFLGLALAHAAQAGIPVLELRQLGVVFCFAFGYEIINWLAAHPLAALVPGGEPLPEKPADSGSGSPVVKP